MPIIKPKVKSQKQSHRISVDTSVLDEINLYCRFAKFHKIDEFFEEAAVHIMTKDKDFKEWKETLNQTDKMNETIANEA